MASTRIPAGPFELIKAEDGTVFPYYIVPFDKEGNCEAPGTRAHLVGAASGHTDIFFFSHGWNNDWTVATERYKSFIDGYQRQRGRHGLAWPDGYRPLLVGIFWPSQTMAWFDSETGPDIASHDPTTAQQAEALIADIAEGIPGARRSRFYELAQADALDRNEAQELADMLAAVHTPDPERSPGQALGAADLLAAASHEQSAGAEPDYGATGATAPQADAGLAAAGGWLEKLDPRNIIKPFTVWQMKDRAGVVGSRGVSSLLEDLLGRSTARIHLFGHSYGCKVVMNALSAIKRDNLRPAYSATLFQAAFSRHAFADRLPDAPGTKGGFHHALARVTGPVVVTYSSKDAPLTRHFHLALRRNTDVGELQAAGGEDSKFGALGGFGPYPPTQPATYLHKPGVPYEFGDGGRVLGMESSELIHGHGDISNEATWWLAYCNVNARHG